MAAPANPVSSPGNQALHWTSILQACSLVALTCLCYLPSLDGGFLWDDHLWLTDNPLVRSFAGLRQIWLGKGYDYLPVTETSFWIEWHLWGADPLGYRLVNLALHLMSAGLLWRLLGLLRVRGAWFGALLFAVHPVNVASVAWIAERKNTLSMVFYLGSLTGYVLSEKAGPADDARRGWYAAALGCFVLAVGCKASVVVLPGILLLLAWWRRGRISRGDLARSVPFFAVSLLSGLVTMWFQYHRSMDPHAQDAVEPLAARLLIAPRVVLFYVWKTLVPTRLSMIYPRWVISASSSAAYLPLLGLAGGLFAGWKARARWGRGPLVGAGYFLLALLPVLGLLPMTFAKFSFVSDHLVYLPMIGLLAALAAGLARWRTPAGSLRWTATATMAALTAWWVLSSYHRAGEFSASERLWRATLASNPGSSLAHNNLGLAWRDAGRLADAEAQFRAALELEPSMPAAATNLADVLRQQGRWREAALAYTTALKLDPESESFNNSGVVYLQLGDTEAARTQFDGAARLEPRLLSPHFNLYNLARLQGDDLRAADELSECLRRDPDDVPSLLALTVLALQSAPAGTVPLEAVKLVRRVKSLVGSSQSFPPAIFSRAATSPPSDDRSAHLPAVFSRIQRCVRELPAIEG